MAENTLKERIIIHVKSGVVLSVYSTIPLDIQLIDEDIQDDGTYEEGYWEKHNKKLLEEVKDMIEVY